MNLLLLKEYLLWLLYKLIFIIVLRKRNQIIMWQPQTFYNQYVLNTPKILLGNGSIRGLYNYPASKIAVIYGNSFSDKKIFLSTFIKNEVKFIQRSWIGEPDLYSLTETVSELESFSPDTIIAVGGGSVIDGSKLCRMFYECPYYKHNETRISRDIFKTNFIAVPTTVGSGAEISSAAVFFDTENSKKDMIVTHGFLPDVIVYDEEYVKATPIRILTASMMDATAHILEGYVSQKQNDFIGIMAESVFCILSNELHKILLGELDQIDYKRLQYSGYIGGIVQNHCIVGAAHAVAHQLTGYGYSHGEAVAIMLPYVIQKNAVDTSVAEKYKKILSYAGFSGIQEYIDFLLTLMEISEIGEGKSKLATSLLEKLNDTSFRNNIKDDKGGKGNPIPITDKYIEELIRSM